MEERQRATFKKLGAPKFEVTPLFVLQNGVRLGVIDEQSGFFAKVD